MYFLLFTHLFKSRTIKLIKPRFEAAYSANLQSRALPNELSQRNYRVSWRDAQLTACLNCYQPASVQIQSIKLDFMLTIRCWVLTVNIEWIMIILLWWWLSNKTLKWFFPIFGIISDSPVHIVDWWHDRWCFGSRWSTCGRGLECEPCWPQHETGILARFRSTIQQTVLEGCPREKSRVFDNQ